MLRVCVRQLKSLKLTSNCSAGRMCLQCTAAACCAFYWLLNLPRNQIKALIECEFRISGHTHKSDDFEAIQEKLTPVFRDNASKQWSPACGQCELFLNVCVSLRIFLTIPATVASAKWFFSKLKLVKNYLRSTMSQTRLVDVARLSTESSIGRQDDFDSVITNFANEKARKALR